MKVTLKMTLDGLISALRWRQIDLQERKGQLFQAPLDLEQSNDLPACLNPLQEGASDAR